MTALQPSQAEPLSTIARNDLAMDALQYQMSTLPQLEQKLTHLFPPGMYVRQLFMPAGSVWMSRIHKTEHPYCVSLGRLRVWSENDGFQHIAAPFLGITRPGARRILLIDEDTLWATFHRNDDNETDVEILTNRLTDMPDVSHIPVLIEQMKRDMCEVGEERKETTWHLPQVE